MKPLPPDCTAQQLHDLAPTEQDIAEAKAELDTLSRAVDAITALRAKVAELEQLKVVAR